MLEFRHNNQLIAITGSISDIESGGKFYGSPYTSLQWSGYRLNQDVVLRPHIHLARERQALISKSVELFIVLQGKLEVKLYDMTKKHIETLELTSGYFICCYDGGHGFKSLEQDTVFIEVKSGPYNPKTVDTEYITEELWQ